MCKKLGGSFLKYQGKNALLLVIKDRSQKLNAGFESLSQQFGVKAVTFDTLCPRPSDLTAGAAANAPVDTPHKTSALDQAPDQEEQYGPADKALIVKIQRRWRKCSRVISSRRAMLALPEDQIMAKYIECAVYFPATISTSHKIQIRKVMFSDGVRMSLSLVAANEKWDRLQQDASYCIENIDVSQSADDESVDKALSLNREAETLLTEAGEKLSNATLLKAVGSGIPSNVEKVIKEAGSLLETAEKVIAKARAVIDTVMKKLS